MKQITFSKLLILVFMLGIYVPGWSQITPQEAIEGMGRGINLGNTFDAPHEGDWAAKAEEVYFDRYVEAGFTTVRIPITWKKHVLSQSPFTIDSVFLNRVEQVVEWGLQRNLFIIINAHHEDWLKEDYANQKERFDSIWSQVSVRFKDKSEKLLFEMLNEPHGSITAKNVDELNVRVLGIIRKNNPTRVVIYSGAGWASSSDLRNAAVIKDDYIMAYYHTYDPWKFAGEGEGTWGTLADRKGIASSMETVQKWSQTNNIPVLIGEFGAMNKCDYNSRMLHYATYTEQALAHGFAFTVWDDGGQFEALNRATKTWNEFKDILIYTSDSSSTLLNIKTVNDSILQLKWTSRSESQTKVLVEKRTSNTEFKVIAELDPKSPTSYDDSDAIFGQYSYYRIVEVYGNDSIPTYPVRAMLISTKREPFLGESIAIPGILQAEDFDKGGELNTYHDTETENQGKAYRLEEGVDIETRDDGFQVGYTEAGEWLEYTIDVASAGNYTFDTYLASLLGGGSLELDFGYVKTGEIIVPKTNSWTTLDVVTETVELEAGEQIVRLKILTIPGFNIDKIEFKEKTLAINEFSSEIKIFPNPVTDELQLSLDEEIKYVQVCNDEGQIILTKSVNASEISINTTSLIPGLYFVLVNTNTDRYKTKFIKQ